MSQYPPELALGTRRPTEGGARVILWSSVVLTAAALIWFFAFMPRFGADRGVSAFGWLMSAWNGETDYEHGLLFPFVIAGLIFYRRKELRASVTPGSLWGLAVVL